MSNLKPFKPGQSGNPRGRPKGARNRLGEAFIRDLADSWDVHGPDAIRNAIINKPDGYLRVVASLLPKQSERVENELSHLSDAELDKLDRLLDSIPDDETPDQSGEDEASA